MTCSFLEPKKSMSRDMLILEPKKSMSRDMLKMSMSRDMLILGPTKGHFGHFWGDWNPQVKKFPNFGRRYILKYGPNRKSKREFPRFKIGQRTRFRNLEASQRHSRPILDRFEYFFQKTFLFSSYC